MSLWWAYVWGWWLSLMLLVIAYTCKKIDSSVEGDLPDHVAELLRRHKFPLKRVAVIYGSASAYMFGFGPFKRMVLTTGLIRRFRPSEVEAIVVHELGHWQLLHIPTLYVVQALGSFVALVVAAHLMESQVLGFLLALALYTCTAFCFRPVWNWISHQMEFEADAYAAHFVSKPELIRAIEHLDEIGLGGSARHPPVEKRIARLR